MLQTSNCLKAVACKSSIVLLILLSRSQAFSQRAFDSLFSHLDAQKWAARLERKTDRLAEKLTTKTAKTLLKLRTQEEKFYTAQLNTKDSLAAKTQLQEINSRYNDALNKSKNSETTGQYIPGLDTLTTSLKFLNIKGYNGNIITALQSAKNLSSQFQNADEIRQFINERRQLLTSQLQQLGLVNELKRFKEQAALYHAQIQEYRNILNEPGKLENTLIQLVSKIPAWKNFFANNSMLAGLFAIPAANPSNIPLPVGLQTRTMVSQNLVQRFGSTQAVNQTLSQNVPSAQNQLQQLKDKLNKYTNGTIGNGPITSESPDHKINQQRAKTFWRRIEVGASMQSQKAYGVLPVTSDIGVIIGYRISDKQIIGIGIAEKIGWGRNWKNLRLTHQGANIRSFLDVKLKGSFWLTGGYEFNYRPSLSSLDSTAAAHNVNLNYWQRSGVIGLSKLVTLKNKTTKVQLLWDLLSYRQKPPSPAIIWRVVYALK